MTSDDECLKGATRQGAGEVIQTRAGQVIKLQILIFIPGFVPSVIQQPILNADIFSVQMLEGCY